MMWLERALYIVFFGISAGAAVASALAVVPRPKRDVGPTLTFAAAVVGVLSLLVRTWVAGHLPLFGTFENAWTCSVAIAIFSVLTARFMPAISDVWRWMMPWATAFMVYGLWFRSEPVALTISEQSIFVDIHVFFAWWAFAALLCAATMSFMRLVGVRSAGHAEDVQRVHDRLVFVGYVALTAMLAVGAFYLWMLFASPWRWEIVGSLSLLSWLLYGMLIHGRLFYRWDGRWYHAAVLAVLPVLLMAFWVWSLYPGTYHFFDIPLVRPY